MRKFVLLTACALLTAFLAGNAAASDLRGRLAVTGRVGIINPANSELDLPNGDRLVVSTDAGIIGGGGFLFGVDDYIAMELDITRSSFHTSKFGTADVTELSIGAQYRLPERQLGSSEARRRRACPFAPPHARHFDRARQNRCVVLS